ncbi:hypothetical protein R6L23_31705, partial [Streptomyces sp. SR27]|nr:hypothetical protein [Streptomyces sp. SR27]
MDYCNACRRHLNGALACAGCGTPVEELRYETPHIPARRTAPPVHVQGYAQAYAPGYAPDSSQGHAPDETRAHAEPDRAHAEPDRAAPEHVYELDVLEPPRPSAGGRRAVRGRA